MRPIRKQARVANPGVQSQTFCLLETTGGHRWCGWDKHDRDTAA